MEFVPLSSKGEGNGELEERVEEYEDKNMNVEKKEFQNGFRLSDDLRKCCPAEKIGIPLEEIDPYYKHQGTFIVIGKGTHVINRFSNDSCLDASNPIRQLAIGIITHWAFTFSMIKIIYANCVASAFSLESSYFTLEILSLVVFVLELILKIIARGLITGKYSYLRMPWNWLDICIIFLGIITFGRDIMWFGLLFHWLTVLRTFKLIPLIPGILSAAIFFKETFIKMIDFIIVSLFPILFFSLLGLQIYMGILTSKCIHDYYSPISDDSDLLENDTERKQLFKEHSENSTNWYTQNGDYKLCGSEKVCPENYTCMAGFGDNPDFGYTNFDSYFWSILTILRLICQDNFQLLYTQILTTAGIWHVIFFALVFFFGTFFLGSFAYAIIGKNFIDSKENSEDCSEVSYITTNIEMSPQKSVQPTGENSAGEYSPFKMICKAIIANRLYEFFVTAIIILDIVFLFSYHQQRGDFYFKLSLGIAGVAVIVYKIEFILKLIAESPIQYFYKFWNCFDCLVLIIAPIYFLMHWISFLNKEVMEIIAAIYSIRALKLAPRWPSLGFLFTIIFQTVKTYIGIFGILAIYLFNFSLIGYILFSTIYTTERPDEIPRWNFSGFLKSLASVLRILGGEWIELLWDSLRFASTSSGCLWATSAYYTLAILFGNFIAICIAISVIITTKNILKTREDDELEHNTSMPENQDENRQTILQLICCPCTWILTKFSECCRLQNTTMYSTTVKVTENEGNVASTQAKRQKQVGIDFKIKVQKFTQSKLVKICSILMILIASIGLAGTQIIGIYYFDIIFTAYFIAEIIFRIIAFGVIASLKDIGLIFDLVIISEMILNFSLYRNFDVILTCNSGACGYFYLRNFRPLMLISRVKKLKAIGEGICIQIFELNSYVWAGVYLWHVFSIIGVYNFGGKFYHCTDEFDGIQKSVVNTISDCADQNLSWIGSDINFNHISVGFISLIHIASLDGWIQIFHDVMDAHDVDLQPIRDRNPISILYFVGFYIIGVVFLFNTFFGVILHTFTRDGSNTLFKTEEQTKSYESKIEAGQKKQNPIPKPQNKILQEIYNLVTNRMFELCILFLILFDCLTFAFDSYKASHEHEELISYIHCIILVFYTLEFVLKILAWRQHYFKQCLNIIDFIMIVSSLLGLICSDLIEKYFISPILFRIFRILRIIQFLQKSQLRRHRIFSLLTAFKLTFPVWINFLFFYCIFMYSYVILGYELFNYNDYYNELKMNSTSTSNSLSGSNRHIRFDQIGDNFNSISNSFLTLFKISTFSGWSNLLQNLVNIEYDCNDTLYDTEERMYTCPRKSYKIGSIYIFTFLTMSFLLVVNMYMVFILEIMNQFNINERAKKEEDEMIQPEVKESNDVEMGNIPEQTMNPVDNDDDQIEVILSSSEQQEI